MNSVSATTLARAQRRFHNVATKSRREGVCWSDVIPTSKDLLDLLRGESQHVAESQAEDDGAHLADILIDPVIHLGNAGLWDDHYVVGLERRIHGPLHDLIHVQLGNQGSSR